MARAGSERGRGPVNRHAKDYPKSDRKAEDGDGEVDDVVVERQGQQVEGKVLAEDRIDRAGWYCADKPHGRYPERRGEVSDDAPYNETDDPGRARGDRWKHSV